MVQETILMLTIFPIQIKHALTYSLAASHWLLVYPWNELIIFSRPQIYFVKLYLYVKIKQKNLSRTISIYNNFFIIYFLTLGLDLKRKKALTKKITFHWWKSTRGILISFTLFTDWLRIGEDMIFFIVFLYI